MNCVLQFGKLNFSVDKVGFGLIELYVLKNRVVSESFISELKLVKGNAIHKESQLNFAEISFGFSQGVVAARISFSSTSQIQEVKPLVVSEISFAPNSYIAIVIKTKEVLFFPFNSHCAIIRWARRIEVVEVLLSTLVVG